MAFLPQCRTGGRGNEMVIWETAPVFAGRYPGILGQYLARIYLEVKNRPVYLLKETDEEETENEG